MPRANRPRRKPAPLGRADFSARIEAVKADARAALLDSVEDPRVRQWMAKLLGAEEGEAAEMGATASANTAKT